MPVIGMGGISCWQDAVQFFLAGADAIAVGTANFANPAVTMEICEGLEKYLESHGLKNITELVDWLE